MKVSLLKSVKDPQAKTALILMNEMLEEQRLLVKQLSQRCSQLEQRIEVLSSKRPGHSISGGSDASRITIG